MNRRTLIIILLALVVAAGGYVGYRQFTANARSNAATLQTATVERGTLVAAVNAAGTVAVPQSASLVWRTSGVLGLVHVALGDTVKAGDALMELDPASLDRTVIQAQADLVAAQQALADLLAGPSALELAQAELRLASARDALGDAQRRWQYQQEGYRASSVTIKAAEAELALAESQMKEAKAKYDELSGRPSDDPTRAQAYKNYAASYQRYQTALINVNWYTGHPTEVQQAILDADVAVAQAELAEAEQALAELQAGPNPADIAAAEARAAAAQATVDLARLVAPFDGTVVAINNQRGDSVSSNTVAPTLADLSHLEVQVDVSELDVNNISIGQEAVLTLDAAPGQTFAGRVADVAFMGTVNQGVVTYPVAVVVDNADPALRPGMTAAVSIVTERRKDVLIVPNRAVLVSGGQRSVTVLFEGAQIPVPVTLGLVGDTTSEVVEGGLREGDVVLISLPTAQQGGFSPGMGGGFGLGH